jgi:hypothetical protein
VSARRAYSILAAYLLFALVLFATHYRLLSLPFFWDEAGQFIPQAWDLYTRGLILPESALPNSHPPGLPLMLAGLWKVTGFSIEATRSFMLLLAAGYLTAAFLLAVELLRGGSGAPAFLAAGFLLAQPLVYTQSMMAQLDLPSALGLTCLFAAYAGGHRRMAIAAALFAVASKETALAIPVTLAFFSWRKGEHRYALLLAGLPALLLANWFAFLYWKTGFVFGDGEYSRYNLVYPLHPVRLTYALLRRVSFLFVENLHVVPAAVLLLRWKAIGFAEVWRPVAAASLIYTLGVSVTGGAVLERYLLPVLPVLYAAFAAALSTLRPRLRYSLAAVTGAAMFICLFINMPWPYALENNLAMVDLVEIQRNAAGLADSRLRQYRITTTWPLSDALEKPYLGYVDRRHERVREIHESSLEALDSLDWAPGDVLIVYSRSRQWPFGRWIVDRFFETPRDLRYGQLDRLTRFRPLIGYKQRGFWVEILILRD